MPIAKITRQGIAVIALAVALLWAFVLLDHFQRQEALALHARVLREMRELQRRGTPVPVSIPAPLVPHRPRFTAG